MKKISWKAWKLTGIDKVAFVHFDFYDQKSNKEYEFNINIRDLKHLLAALTVDFKQPDFSGAMITHD